MSDPVSNAEVEDVLSSIRRLVSEEKRPLQATRPAAAADRLVLTPALRVGDGPEDDAQRPASDAVQDTDAPKAGRDMPDGAAADTTETDIQSILSDDTTFDVYGGKGEVRDEEATSVEEAVAKAARAVEDDYSDDPHGFADDVDDDFEDEDAYLRKSYPQDDQTPEATTAAEPEASDDTAVEPDQTDSIDELAALLRNSRAAAIERVADAPFAEDVQEERIDNLTEIPSQSTTPAASVEPKEEGHQSAITLSSKIAALETAIGKIADTWEPDDPGESEYAGTEPDSDAMEWEDDLPEPEEAPAPLSFARRVEARLQPSEPEHVEEPEVEEAQVPTEPLRQIREEPSVLSDSEPEQPEDRADGGEDHLDLAEDEQLIDEEALRDLVSEIVRAELQGALGERITRNVRKLVRREIHRALTAQELE